MNPKKISILLPSYNEAEQLPETLRELPRHLPEPYDYELLFVDDGSSDRSWEILRAAAAADPHVRALRFSRNFGKEKALMAGLLNADGDAVIVMDCDLQHPPAKIPEMLALWEQGYKVVEGFKSDRGRESLFSKTSANLFYSLFRKASRLDLKNASDFKLLDREVLEVFRQLPEKEPFFRGLAAWVGFPRTSFRFEVQPRNHGHSRWNILKLAKLSLDALAAFSARPFAYFPIFGSLFALIALIDWLRSFRAADGGRLALTAALFFIGSILLFGMAILGFYLARAHEALLARPRYLISERLNEPKPAARTSSPAAKASEMTSAATKAPAPGTAGAAPESAAGRSGGKEEA